MAKKKEKKLGESRIPSSDIISKIERLEELSVGVDDKDKTTIENYRKNAQFITRREELKNDPAIQILLKSFQDEIDGINETLLSSKEPMDNAKRQELLSRKELAEKHISFYSAGKQLEILESEVDQQLKFLIGR